MPLDEIVSEIKDVDIIVEGYKDAGKPSIEIVRDEMGYQPISEPDHLMAYVANRALNSTASMFDLDDAKSIASFIVNLISKL